MQNWLKINLIFAAIEMGQGLFIALWVYNRAWVVAAMAAATFLSLLVIHVLTGASVIATWLLAEMRQMLLGDAQV